MQNFVAIGKFVYKNSGVFGGVTVAALTVYVIDKLYDLANKAIDNDYDFSIDGDGVKISKPRD